MGLKILVIEDDVESNRTIVENLEAAGHRAVGVFTAAAARAEAPKDWDVVLLDVRLPDGDGLDVFRTSFAHRRDVAVIMMTGHGTIAHAVKALKLGVRDYLTKPFEVSSMVEIIDGVVGRGEPPPAPSRHGSEAILGSSSVARELRTLVKKVSASEASMLLLTGESGTGKDLVARAIHEESRRSGRPFMTITCTAIADQLFESELFGHEKGAFTNALSRKLGLLELADGGTVFLDEIGDLAPPLQAKLLRFLQERTFKRVGGVEDITVDVRVIAATHQPLASRVADGSFRSDLYHRIKVIELAIPPLRARLEDVSILADAFAADLATTLGRKVEGFTEAAYAALGRYHWPGNVRELRNVVECALVLGGGSRVDVADLPPEVRNARGGTVASTPVATEPQPAGAAPAGVDANYVLPNEGIEIEEVERELVLQALRRARGNKSHAARLLGLSRDQIRYRLKKYGAPPHENFKLSAG